jgi:hypothetical protein
MNSPRATKLSTDFFRAVACWQNEKTKRDAMFGPDFDPSQCFLRVPDKALSIIAARLFILPSGRIPKSVSSHVIFELSTGVDNSVRNLARYSTVLLVG